MDTREAMDSYVSFGRPDRKFSAHVLADRVRQRDPEFTAYKVKSWGRSGGYDVMVVGSKVDVESLHSALAITGHRVVELHELVDPNTVELRKKISVLGVDLDVVRNALDAAAWHALDAFGDVDKHDEAACGARRCMGCAVLRRWRLEDAVTNGMLRWQHAHHLEQVQAHHRVEFFLKLTGAEWRELVVALRWFGREHGSATALRVADELQLKSKHVFETEVRH